MSNLSKNYYVDYGKTITAGDVVAYIKENIGSNFTGITSETSVDCFDIGNGRYFVIAGFQNSYVVGAICSVSGNTVTRITEQNISSNTCFTGIFKATQLDTNRIYITYPSSSGFKAFFVDISGDTITSSNETIIFGSSSVTAEDNIKISNNEILSLYGYNFSRIHGQVVTINNDTVVAGTDKELVSTLYSAVRGILLEENKALLFYLSSSSSNEPIIAKFVTISGTDITDDGDVGVGVSTNGANWMTNILQLEPNRLLLSYSKNSNNYLYGKVLNISGNTITYGNEIQIRNVNGSGLFHSSVLLDNNRVLFTHGDNNNNYVNGCWCSTSGNTIVVDKTEILLSVSYSGATLKNFLLDTNKALILSKGGIFVYTMNLVEPTTAGLEFGKAKESGASGDKISVEITAYKDCFAYYKLDSLDDGIAVDSTGNGIDLNKFNDNSTDAIIYTSSGKINGGISCTYNASYGSVLSTKQSVNDHWGGITDPTKIEKVVSENKTYTISAWAYIKTTYNYDQVVANILLTNGSNSGIEQINVSYNTVDLGGKWCCWTGMYLPSWSTVPAVSGYNNQWVHLVCIVEPNYITLYLNGNFIKKQQRSGTNNYNNSDIKGVILCVGNGEWFNRKFDGYIDEVGYWNRGLSESEIAALYNNGAGISYESGPTYLVELTDGVGVTDNVDTKTDYHVEIQDYGYTTDSEDINQDTTISLRDNIHTGDNVKVKVDYKVDIKEDLQTKDDQRIIVYKNGIDSIWTNRTKPNNTTWTNRPKPWIAN